MTVLACDFGGTRTKLGLIRDGTVIAGAVVCTQAGLPFAVQLDTLAAEFRALCQRSGVALGDCAGLGVSFPSIVDSAAVALLDDFAKFPEAVGFDLRGWASRALGLPVAIENDARMALLGEWRFGAGRGCDDLVMITLGTGIGAAAIMQGRLLRGAHGQAAILGGHFTMQYNGELCHCGNLGCAEAEASTAALPRIARALSSFSGSALALESVLDYAAVFRLAAAGDVCSKELATHSVRLWAATAVNLVHAFDPSLVVLGGGIMASGETILPAIRDYVHRHAHTPWGKVEVVVAALGDQAALLACEPLVKEQCQ
jgi:glucokinase